MISIIICSRKARISDVLKNNIDITIGVPYELIVIDNSQNTYSIFEAYNVGVQKSKFNIICFMHDDILYHTDGWGKIVEGYFHDPALGMIGVGGTRFLSRIPSVWWAGGSALVNCPDGTICHNSIDTNPECLTDRRHNVINPASSQCNEVVILDGLWFCIDRKLFDVISFDTKTFNGFHFYDLDISLQIQRAGKKLFVIYDVTVEHISKSNHDLRWVDSCFKLYNKWRTVLPLSAVKYDSHIVSKIEYDNFRILLNILKSNRHLFLGLIRMLPFYFIPLIKMAVRYNWFFLYLKKKLD